MHFVERSLAIFAITALLAPQPASAQANKSDADADQKELYSYVLTVDKLHKLADATRDMKEWQKKNPQAADEKADTASEEGSISQRVKDIEAKTPELVAIVRKNGLTTREYMVALLVLMQASILVGMKKATDTEYSKDATTLVSPANLAFVEQHWEELQKMNLGADSKNADDKN
jgi:hypothetical protein